MDLHQKDLDQPISLALNAPAVTTRAINASLDLGDDRTAEDKSATSTVGGVDKDFYRDPAPAPLIHVVAIVFAVLAPFAAVIWAMYSAWINGFMGWLYLNMVFIGWLLTGTGITIGYHRLLTHRAFETTSWIRAYFMVMGALALQKSPLEWCAVHRKHHELSDDRGDPHSPHVHAHGVWNSFKGIVYSHFGWLFTGHLPNTNQDRYVRDLKKDRLAVSIDKYYYVFWAPLSFLIPALIGGLVTSTWMGAWLGLLWGGFVRIFIVHHITWSINSVCHLIGSREFHTQDHSRNNFLCGILGHGEGWHNNHHAFPRSARHGLRWWQFDTSYLIIRTLEFLGLAWNVQLPSDDLKHKKRLTK